MDAGIVEIGSMSSIFSIAGLPLLLVCIGIIASKKVWGWVTVLNIAIFAMIWVGLSKPDIINGSLDDEQSSLAPFVFYKGEWQNEKRLMVDSNKGLVAYDSDWLIEEPYRDARRYAMHVNGLPEWVYHPDALWWAPTIACGIGLLCAPSWWPVILGSIILGGNRKK